MSLPVNREIYQNRTKNMLNMHLECSEHLVFKPFLVTMIKILMSEAHLALDWPQLATGTPCGSHSSRNN